MTTFLIIALLAYNVFLAYYLLSRDKPTEETTKPQEGQDNDTVSVVGKSRFSMKESSFRPVPTPATAVPNAATSDETEAVDLEDTTFADETDEKPSRQIPADRLDESFTDIRMEDITGRDESEDEEDEPDTPTARGTSFEDIDRAVKSVRKSEAEEKEKLHAGRTFKDIAETELFQKITESFTGISDRVNEAIDLYTARAMQVKPLVLPERIEDFDIRDFV